MLVKKIKYTDFAGNEREGEIYFNLTRAELIRWMITDEGLITRLQSIQGRSGKEIMDEFDNIIKRSFGVRSDDGKRFIKNDEVYNDFIQTALYDEFFMKLVTDPEEAKNFMNALLPQDLVAEAQSELSAQKKAGVTPSYAQENSEAPSSPAQESGGASGI